MNTLADASAFTSEHCHATACASHDGRFRAPIVHEPASGLAPPRRRYASGCICQNLPAARTKTRGTYVLLVTNTQASSSSIMQDQESATTCVEPFHHEFAMKKNLIPYHRRILAGEFLRCCLFTPGCGSRSCRRLDFPSSRLHREPTRAYTNAVADPEHQADFDSRVQTLFEYPARQCLRRTARCDCQRLRRLEIPMPGIFPESRRLSSRAAAVEAIVRSPKRRLSGKHGCPL